MKTQLNYYLKVHTYTLDKDVSTKDKEEVLNSNQPLNIVYGVCTGEYELQDLSNKKT